MPSVFLSPSTQEYNLYATNGNEEYYMNQITDRIEPYLSANGISFSRNDPSLTVGGSVRLSNEYSPDIHLALHSNAAPESMYGRIQGIDVFFYPGSQAGEAFADIVAKNFATIYPHPELVGTSPTTTLYELRNTAAPAVLVEIGYHDNLEDEQWIVNNLNQIAQVLALSVSEYFDIPFSTNPPTGQKTVSTQGFSVNIRNEPNWAAAVRGVAPNGAAVTVLGDSNGWSLIDYRGVMGYINNIYLQ